MVTAEARGQDSVTRVVTGWVQVTTAAVAGKQVPGGVLAEVEAEAVAEAKAEAVAMVESVVVEAVALVATVGVVTGA